MTPTASTIDPAHVQATTAPVTPEAIDQGVEAIVTQWLFPSEGAHIPDDDDLLRGDKYRAMLRQRMEFLASIGADPTGMTGEQLLPGVAPSQIELTTADLASC